VCPVRGSARIKALLAWGILLVLPCYLIDQVTKLLILKHLQIGQAITILPGYFEILHVRNTGAAFGILQGLPDPYRTIFFLVITILACGAMLMIFRHADDDSIFLKAALCLILAGALGNLTDRLIHQEVVDFINVHVQSWRWPTFNIADSYISVGMVVLIISMMKSPKPKLGME
jgi:signal peptidase II